MQYWREEPYYPPEHPDEFTLIERSPDMNEITRDAIEQELNALESCLWNATHLNDHAGIVFGQTMNPFPNYEKMRHLIEQVENEISTDIHPEFAQFSKLITFAWLELNELNKLHKIEIKRIRTAIDDLTNQLEAMDADRLLEVLPSR